MSSQDNCIAGTDSHRKVPSPLQLPSGPDFELGAQSSVIQQFHVFPYIKRGRIKTDSVVRCEAEYAASSAKQVEELARRTALDS